MKPQLVWSLPTPSITEARAKKVADIWPLNDPLKVGLKPASSLDGVRATKAETLLVQANLARFRGDDFEADWLMLRVSHAATGEVA